MKNISSRLISRFAFALLPLALLATLVASDQMQKPVDHFTSTALREESKACLDCHDEHRLALAGTAHDFGDPQNSGGIGCNGCHDGGAAHMEDPTADNIGNPSQLSPSAEAALCARCHNGAHQSSMSNTDPHAIAGLDCASCHTIHRDTADLTAAHKVAAECATCHQSVMAEFRRSSSHPLEAGQLQCISCHDLSGMTDKLFAQGSDWNCQRCHSEQSGPFPHEHPVTSAHLVNGGNCGECHEPHGSANDRLLKQPASNLCIQCHAIPAKHRTEHAGLGTKLPCADCHSSVHGSFDNAKLLDPDLGTRLFPNCYQSGCHDLQGAN